MAMASSGTDLLARLQAGSKELRAERELCQVAAKQGFITENGAATSTYQGPRLAECVGSARRLDFGELIGIAALHS